MTKTKKELLRAVEQAADLRAAGWSWEQIASRVKRHVRTVREWPHAHAELWKRRMAVAKREQDEEMVGQARLVLCHLLRDDDAKVARESARILLTFARSRLEPLTEIAPTNSPFHRIADELEGMSHEELCQFVDTELAQYSGDVLENEGRNHGA